MKIFWHGVLGMNARNLNYIRTKNVWESVSLADSKLKTKNFLSVRWIPFADTYATIASQQELNDFSFDSIPSDAFVIKPNHGSKGQGILIVKKLKNNNFYISGREWTEDEVRLYMTDILSGSFSLYGNHDKIVIEELLRPGYDFAKFCRYGLADIRMIVYNYVPITTMVRMPTELSEGKANLAQGGIGLGLNIATGQVMNFFQNKKSFTKEFPDGYQFLKWLHIPFWDDILLYSSQIQFYTGLWYLALDWVITESGPKLLEINARAGLEIQNVNLVPLKSRLDQVEKLKITTPEKGVEVAKMLFHPTISHVASGKKVISFSQKANVRGVNITLKVDPFLAETKISENLVKKITKNTVILLQNGVQLIISPNGGILEGGEKNVIILGQNDLKDCLISPIIESEITNAENHQYPEYIYNIDKKLYNFSRKMVFSSIFRPKNFSSEFNNFLQNPHEYNPVFEYNFPSEKVFSEIALLEADLEVEIAAIQHSDPIFYQIFSEKLRECVDKKNLILAYKNQDFEQIFHNNEKLYGAIDAELLQIASQKVFEKATKWADDKQKILGKLLSVEEIQQWVEEYLKKQNIENIPVKISHTNLSRMSVSYKKSGASINIAITAKIYENELASVLAHEIGVHLRRYLEGQKTGLKIFENGLGYHLTDEEGLAVYNSFRFLPDNFEKNAMYFNYYILAQADTLSFSQLTGLLRTMYPEWSLEKIFLMAMRFKRGIVNTSVSGVRGASYYKDKIYLDGYNRVKKWVENGGDIESLYFWKIKISDISLISQF